MRKPWIILEFPELDLGERPELGEIYALTGTLKVIEVVDRIGGERHSITVVMGDVDVRPKAQWATLNDQKMGGVL